MWIGRLIGRLFVWAALVALGMDLRPWLDGGAFDLSPLGAVWFKLDKMTINKGTINMLEAGITRHIDDRFFGGPTVYPVVQQIELFPAVYVIGALGLIFLYLFRRRRPRLY